MGANNPNSIQAISTPTYTSKYVANNGTLEVDNLSVKIVESGECVRIGTVSGTATIDASGWCTYNLNADAQYASSRANLSLTTTHLNPFNWSATKYKGNEARLTIHDTTNNKVYRVTAILNIIGGSNHFITIEKLN